jgi:hypothetical protein
MADLRLDPGSALHLLLDHLADALPASGSARALSFASGPIAGPPTSLARRSLPSLLATSLHRILRGNPYQSGVSDGPFIPSNYYLLSGTDFFKTH